jgi:SAM-dependent methyltransferase
MSRSDPDWRALNRAHWDELAALHLGPSGYDLAALRAGNGRLNPIEEAELPPVAGRRVLHLQCHFGKDSLTLAQRGADVTGLDFSPPAIAAARGLAAELGLTDRASFVAADLYDALAAVPRPHEFDLVFVSWGALCWLPDIAGWARIAAAMLRRGGSLYLADAHPVAYVFDDAAAGAEGMPGWFAPYFSGQPIVISQTRDYIDTEARLANPTICTWIHPLAAILGAVLAAGLRLDWLHEHDAIPWRLFEILVRHPDRLWRWPDQPWLPLSFSLAASRPLSPP